MFLHLHLPRSRPRTPALRDPVPPRPRGLRRLRLLVTGLGVLLLASQLVGPPARAERPAPTSRLTAAEAREAGQAITVSERAVGSSTLLVATLPKATVQARADAFEAARLLDVTDDAAFVVAADLIADQAGTITLQRDDGSQLLVSVPGVIDAELAPDQRWLAALDGGGRLLRIDATSGALSGLAARPFIGVRLFERDGTLLLLAVSSVEAPWQSRLVRLDPQGGALVALSGEDELVYGIVRLADGIAYTAHDATTGTTVVNRVAPTGPQRVADLGAQAIDADIGRDGSSVAYEVTGDGIYVQSTVTGETRRVGSGSHPRFSPNGDLLAVRRGGGTTILALDGSVLDRLPQATATWSDCSAECAP